MPMRAPSLRSCGCVVKSGDRCPHMIAADKERKARFDKTRPNFRQRGYTTKWDKERAVFLQQHPRCAMCPQPSRVVDHITPHKGDPKLFWNRRNWQALCTSCHSSRKQRMEARR